MEPEFLLGLVLYSPAQRILQGEDDGSVKKLPPRGQASTA